MTTLIKRTALLSIAMMLMSIQVASAIDSLPFNLTTLNNIYQRERQIVVNKTNTILNLFFNDVENGLDQVIKSSPLVKNDISGMTSDAISYLKTEVSKKINQTA